jgi:hypothetical protein
MQAPLEDDNGDANGNADRGIQACVRAEGMNYVTGNSNNKNKEQTDKNDIHNSTSPEQPLADSHSCRPT